MGSVHGAGADLAIKIEHGEVHEQRARARVRPQLLLDSLDSHVLIETDLKHTSLEVRVSHVKQDGALAPGLTTRFVHDVVAQRVHVLAHGCGAPRARSERAPIREIRAVESADS